MKAVGFYRYLPIEDGESLLDLQIEKPSPAERDLLVQVKAVSVNPIDVKNRAPRDQVETIPQILGRDVAGIVTQTGADCSLFQQGDEVYYAGSNIRPGGNSEFHLVNERLVGRKPRNLTFAEAAAIPLTSLTAREGLFERLGIAHDLATNQGKTILVIGAAGGVGSIATQLASLVGLTVIGTASRPASVQWSRAHGSAHTINYTQPFAPQLAALGFPQVDYIFCLNTPVQHWHDIVTSIAPQGKICSVLPFDTPVDLFPLFQKSATLVWELMFTRPIFQTADMIEQHRHLEAMTQLIEAQRIQTTMTELLEPINAANMRLAHAKIESGQTIGKIVLANF